MTALTLHSALLMLISTPVVARQWSSSLELSKFDVLCKLVITIKMYAGHASMNWMFVEGWHLHTKVASAFSHETNFAHYHAIGWGKRTLFKVSPSGQQLTNCVQIRLAGHRRDHLVGSNGDHELVGVVLAGIWTKSLCLAAHGANVPRLNCETIQSANHVTIFTNCC